MARNSASTPSPASPPSRSRRRLSLASAVVLWLAVVGLTQGALCAELGEAVQRMENSIELRLQPPATLHDAPSRSSEPEPIEPWELVGV